MFQHWRSQVPCRSAYFIFAALFLFHSVVYAQKLIAAKEKGHPPIHLELRFNNGQRQFHAGELIPVEMIFSSQKHKKVGFYEDCRREQDYIYQVIPEGFIDRNSERDAAGFGGGDAGCHGWQPEQHDLAEKPYTIKQTLNDWFRIEKSGHYKVSVTVWRTGVPVSSAPTDIEILPSDPVWEREELLRIIAMMDSKKVKQRSDGCERLSYLETLDAELEMAKRYQTQDYCDQNLYPALINARNRKQVLEELEAGIRNPTHAIRPGYLGITAKISLYQEHPDWYPIPVSNNKQPDPMPVGVFGFRSKLWNTPGVIQEKELYYAGLLLAALPDKQNEARAISVKTILDLDSSFLGDEVPQKFIDAAKKMAPQILSHLPGDEQEKLLQKYWLLIKSPEIIPVLKRLSEEEGKRPNGIALRRLAEIAPDVARAVIFEKLRADVTEYSYKELSLLPDKEIPELDDILLGHLENKFPHGYTSFSEQAALIARYASLSIADKLKKLVQGKMNTMDGKCAAFLIAYFLRVDSATGKEMLKERLAYTGVDNFQFLSYLAETRYSPEVEDAALSVLGSQDTSMVLEALEVLQQYGSRKSRHSVLQNFQAWNSRWRLNPGALQTRKYSQEGMVEANYLDALAIPRMWLSSAKEITTLKAFCVTQNCRERAEALAVGADISPVVIVYDNPVYNDAYEGYFDVGIHGRIGGIDSLKQKLTLYPRGTVFIIRSNPGSYDQLQSIYSTLRPWASQQGYELNLQQRKPGTMIINSMN